MNRGLATRSMTGNCIWLNFEKMSTTTSSLARSGLAQVFRFLLYKWIRLAVSSWCGCVRMLVKVKNFYNRLRKRRWAGPTGKKIHCFLQKKKKKKFPRFDWLFGVKNILKSLELYAIDRNVEFKTMNIFHITSKGIILCVRSSYGLTLKLLYCSKKCGICCWKFSTYSLEWVDLFIYWPCRKFFTFSVQQM